MEREQWGDADIALLDFLSHNQGIQLIPKCPGGRSSAPPGKSMFYVSDGLLDMQARIWGNFRHVTA